MMYSETAPNEQQQTAIHVFYDVTTLYFEAAEEDELRRIGFSKDGKSQNHK
ncbi:MAG: hypothetical protein IPG12_09705 [Saprospiraceae bacterium]|nr:hypothetical protein [Saprospiraceae bacterium]